MKMILIAAAALALAACTRVHMKDDGTMASARDIQECEYEAMKAAGGSGSYFSLTRPSVVGQEATIKDKCLELRGYKPRVVQGDGR